MSAPPFQCYLPSRLLADAKGNVLAIVALCLPVLLIVIGGGIDMSRAYMARTSLQNACDAGVLAGRRAMNKSGVWGTSEQAKARKMFDFNFQGSAISAGSTTFTMADNGRGEIGGTASTTVPATVMKIFGKSEFGMTATCGAELQMASADVMFVLDTTGSMACDVNGFNCLSGSTSKIQGLRDAVKDFYKTVATAVTDKNTTRVRFGFVPYSGTVNAGALVQAGDIPSSYFTDTTNYQTRNAYFGTPVTGPVTGSPQTTIETYSSNIKSRDCDNYGINTFPSGGNNPTTSGSAPNNVTTSSYAWNSWTYVSGSGSNAIGTCTRRKTTTVTTYNTVVGYRFSYYVYQQAAVPTAAYKGFGNVSYVTSVNSTATVPSQGTYDMVTLAGMSGTSGLNKSTATWDGCIEERATVNDLDMDPVPSGATDLDINSAPSSDATRWKPYWGEMMVYRYGYLTSVASTTWLDGSTEYCPSSMMKFTNVDVTDPNTVPSWLDTYLANLVARGGTYHDIGMIWGGRLASPNGIMASNVNNDPTRQPSRHIIFLTDGEMAPTTTVYSAYGMELYDNRVAPSGTSSTSLVDYHNNRFLAACKAAKAEGYTIWVISFGLALTDELKACASGSRSYSSSDTATLKATFRYIASEVGELRINK